MKKVLCITLSILAWQATRQFSYGGDEPPVRFVVTTPKSLFLGFIPSESPGTPVRELLNINALGRPTPWGKAVDFGEANQISHPDATEEIIIGRVLPLSEMDTKGFVQISSGLTELEKSFWVDKISANWSVARIPDPDARYVDSEGTSENGLQCWLRVIEVDQSAEEVELAVVFHNSGTTPLKIRGLITESILSRGRLIAKTLDGKVSEPFAMFAHRRGIQKRDLVYTIPAGCFIGFIALFGVWGIFWV